MYSLQNSAYPMSAILSRLWSIDNATTFTKEKVYTEFEKIPGIKGRIREVMMRTTTIITIIFFIFLERNNISIYYNYLCT